MPSIRVLGKGARITAGVICLLLALHSWGWVLYDFAELGPGDTWALWTGTEMSGDRVKNLPATTSVTVGLGVLQLTAAIAALTGARAAGGLLACATALTIAFRLPVLWGTALHEPDTPFYMTSIAFIDPELELGLFTTAWLVNFAGIAGIVLLAARRRWPATPPLMAPGFPAPPPVAQEPPPMRPLRAAAVVTAVFLAIMAAFNIGWNFYVLAEINGEAWADMFTGEHTLSVILDVPAAWQWVATAVLCGVAAVLVGTRRIAARGLALGIAAVLLPQAFLTLWGHLENETLFELGDTAEGAAFFSRLETVLTVIGSLVVLVLMGRRGEPVPEPGGMHPGGAYPGGMPPGPAFGWQQPVPPQPGYGYPGPPAGGYGYPGPPAGGPVVPPPPPGAPVIPPPPSSPPPSGGFGPPQ